MRKLGPLGQGIALGVGSAIGVAGFLLFCSFLAGTPIRDSFLSAHGVLTAGRPQLTAEQSAVVLDLLQKGALISSSDLLSQIGSFYSTMIQVLIATFFIFGALSFFAVQAHTRRQVEDAVDNMVTRSTRQYFSSTEFDNLIREKTDSSLEIEMEAYERKFEEFERTSSTVNELENRVAELANATTHQGRREE